MATRTGGTGADVFDAAALGEFNEANTYFGRSGDDTLVGGALKDSLVGGEGGDRLLGDDGADILVDRGKVGDDRLDGGAGDDMIESRYGNDTLIGGAGHDTVTFGFGAMLIDGGTGDDTFIAIGQGPASSTITGGAGDDVLYAGASADVFDGGQGEDLVDYSATRTGIVVNFLTGETAGGAAGDAFQFVEDVIGTDLSDVIIGDGAYNVFLGGAGDDTLGGGFGGDYLDGGDGFDVADLGAGGSTGVVANLATRSFGGGGADGDTLLNFEGLIGSDFADALRGDAGANLLIGRAGADTLDGVGGADTLVGGLGADLYRVSDLDDTIVETVSAGVDTVEATISYSLAGAANVENLKLIGPGALSGTGNASKNVITGNEFDNVLDGGAGADTMIGGAGNDTYYADSRLDIISDQFDRNGFNQVFSSSNFDMDIQPSKQYIDKITLTGSGDLNIVISLLEGQAIGNSGDNLFDIQIVNNASLTGGGGRDVFYFRSPGSGPVAITDFDVSEDIIQVNGGRPGLPDGRLDPSRFVIGTSAVDANTRYIYDDATGRLFEDLDGTGRRYSAELFVVLSPGLDLSADDFLVV